MRDRSAPVFRSRQRCPIAVEALEARTLLSVELVKDINPATTAVVTPSSLVNAGGTLFFVAGGQLYKSDGTTAGTAAVTSAISNPTDLTSAGGTLYFLYGGALWKSDGTPGGTVQVSGAASGIKELTSVGATLYFRATDASGGTELWKIDGTPAGAMRVKDINPGAASSDLRGLTNVNGRLFFHANDGASGEELWTSDGSDAGTVRVKDINPGPANSEPLLLTNVNGTLFFIAHDADNSGYELWKSDGSEGGTARVKDIRPGLPGSSPTSLVNVNGTLMFVATDGQHGFELWKSDGTDAGTAMVRDIVPGGGGAYLDGLTVAGSTLFFTADDGASGRELWKSDATAAGTVRLKDINPGAADSNPVLLTAGGNRLFFTANDGQHGQELWTSDGSEGGTVLAKDIYEGGVNLHINQLTAMGAGRILFVGDDSSGESLWTSDGTPGGTSKVKTITITQGQDSGITPPVNVNGTLFFTAYDVPYNQELWKSDGTEAGTKMVVDLTPGGQATRPTELTNVGGKLYFQALGKLYTSDGSAAGTVPVSDVAMSPSKLTAVGDTIYFLGSDGGGQELWKSDGTAGGTARVKDIRPGGAGSSVDSLTNVNGTLFFVADDGSGGGQELWKSDGTDAGTLCVKDIRPGPASCGAYLLTNVNGTLFFRASDGVNGYELWKSDGTDAGTVMVKDIRPGPGDACVRSLTAVGSTLFFAADDGVHGLELWKSDGTPGGTSMVCDIMPGPHGSTPFGLTSVNGMLLLRADDGVHGGELWKSDGSEAGTVLLKDIRPGPGQSDMMKMTSVDGQLIFLARGYDGPFDIWRSDGTPQGTFGTGYPGQYLWPNSFTVLNGELYIDAWKSDTGTELRKASLTPTTQPATTPATLPATTQLLSPSASPPAGGGGGATGDIFYDTTIRADKPATVATSGLAPAMIDYSSVYVDFFHNEPDETAARALARRAAALGQPLVFDIENWPIDNRYLSEAVVQYNLERLEQVVDWAHDEVPGLSVGLYSLLTIDGFPAPPAGSPGYAAWHAANERVRPLIDRVDVLYPGAYTFTPHLGTERDSVEAMLSEAATYGKPVRPFLWSQYLSFNPSNGENRVPAEYWRTLLDLGRDQADGAMIWGGPWQDNDPWWVVTRDFLIAPDSLAAATPSNLTANAVSTSRIDLTWKDNAYNETGYRIERKASGGAFATVQTVGRNVATFSDTGLAGSTNYVYRVIAINSAGDSQSSGEASARTLEVPPAAPTSPGASAASTTRVDVTWGDGSENEQGFAIERAVGDAGSFAQIDTVGENVTKYVDAGLVPGTLYRYRVRAYNSAGYSSYSDEAPATTPLTSSSLLGWWRMDEGAGTSAADSIGTHDGTLAAGAGWSAAGQLGAAINLDGVDDNVAITDASDLHFTAAQDFTISAWVNLATLPGHRSGIVTRAGTGIWLDASGHWALGGTSADVTAVTVASTGWSLVTAVQDGAAGTRKLYVNGVEVAAGVAQAADAAGNLWIGGNASASGEFFAGKIDDVRLYSRALSAGDVAALAGPHLTLPGTAGADAWTIRIDPTGGQDQFFLNGAPIFTRPTDAVGSIDVLGGGGDDVLTLEFADGDPLPLYCLHFDGGGGNDTLQLHGAGTALPLLADATNISRGSKSISRSDVESIELAGGNLNATGDLAANLIVQNQALAVLNTTQHLPSLSIAVGGRVRLASGGDKVLVANALSVAAGGWLDLHDGKLITHAGAGSWNAGSYTGVAGLIRSGRAGGDWSGSGILTSDPRAINGNFVTLAVAKVGDVRGIPDDQTTLFAGQTVLGSDTVVLFTYAGDANLDGRINVDDYGRIDFNVPLGTNGYVNGDFNLDGKVNVDDYGILDFNVGIQEGSLLDAEPTATPRVARLVSDSPVFASSTDAWSNLVVDATDEIV